MLSKGRAGLLIVFMVMLNSLNAQVKLRKMPGPPPRSICYADDRLRELYIPPPEGHGLKSGETAGSIIEIDVINAPDTMVHVIAKEVADIWASLLFSPVKIRIEVEFDDDLGTGTLGSTGAENYYLVNENGHLPGLYCATALAEKLYGTNINGDLPDMYVAMNPAVNWYFGTDGEAGARYDFMTVLLHEIAHGLGFIGFFQVENGLGDGYSPSAVFDYFLENAKEEKIADTLIFPLGSLELGFQLQKSPIYFKSPLALQGLGEIPKLFVPNTWDNGSSVYHLDEVYNDKNGGRDALMTFSTRRGEAIHDPGPITTLMFYEMGWLHTRIKHDSLKDRENLVDPFTVTAVMDGDTTLSDSSQYLFYSFDGGQVFDSLPMALTGNPDEYTADIPVSSTGIGVNYFLRVEDTLGREYTLPSGAPGNSFGFYVGTDTIFPTIEHRPIAYILVSNDTIEVLAKIWDNLGIDTARVEYMINDVIQEPLDLVHDTLSDYKTYLIFSLGQLNAGDVIRYRIRVVDGSQAQYTTYHPQDGYHSFIVEEIPLPRDEYQNDFEIEDHDFLISDGFSRQKPDGFSSYALHSDHPYPEPNKNNTWWDFTAQLRYPVRLSASNSLMTFDEIAFIEPGSSGTVWPDENFFDYVIVEGSEDGKEWHELTEGYDCREYSEWNAAYNAEIQGGNSKAVPAEDLLRTRVVDLVTESRFEAGDTILIRFRLNSDPFSVGWGWMIDNLKIQGSTLIPEYPLIPGTISVYPNPSTGLINASFQMKEGAEQIHILVTDLLGREVLRDHINHPGQEFRRQYDLKDLPNGVYLMQFRTGHQREMKKIILSR